MKSTGNKHWQHFKWLIILWLHPVTKHVLNLEVCIGAENEALVGVPHHVSKSGAGVVTRLTSRWKNKR
jgi:hypothetical protein